MKHLASTVLLFRGGLLGNQTPGLSFACRMFIKECPGDEHLWEGEDKSWMGQRETGTASGTTAASADFT